jgi:hypothetical protein
LYVLTEVESQLVNAVLFCSPNAHGFSRARRCLLKGSLLTKSPGSDHQKARRAPRSHTKDTLKPSIHVFTRENLRIRT